jgi:hypothetical protein
MRWEILNNCQEYFVLSGRDIEGTDKTSGKTRLVGNHEQ